MIKVVNQIKRMPQLRGLISIFRPLYRQLRTRYLRISMPNGGYLICNNIKVFCNFYNKSYYWYDADSIHLFNEMRLFQNIIDNQEGNVYLDIGAHFGYFSRVIAERIINTDKKLICLEPDRDSFKCLQKTLEDLRCKCNIELLPYALSETDGAINMYESDTDCLHTYRDTNVTSSVRYKVKGISLDNLVAEKIGDNDRIAFIKIDIDGSEQALFAGGINTIRRHKPIIFTEFAPWVIRKAGGYPIEYFGMLNREFMVYWYKNYKLQRVTSDDYTFIEQSVKDGSVTDFLLTYSEVKYESA